MPTSGESPGVIAVGRDVDVLSASLQALCEEWAEESQREDQAWRLSGEPLAERDFSYVDGLLHSVDPNDRRELHDSIHGGPASHPRVALVLERVRAHARAVYERVVQIAEINLDTAAVDFEREAAEESRVDPDAEDFDPDQVEDRAFFLAADWYASRAAEVAGHVLRFQRRYRSQPNHWHRPVMTVRRSRPVRPCRRRRRPAVGAARSSRGDPSREPAPDPDLARAGAGGR